jgi:hypothetical protein
MSHEKILRTHFYINREPEDWVSLETPGRKRLPGFRTNRIAKVYEGELLYFTIGETQRGKRYGLSDTIAKIVGQNGLESIYEPATGGRPNLYVGLDLSECSPVTLERILQSVERAIAVCS